MKRRVLSIGDPVPYLRYIHALDVELVHIQSRERLGSLQDFQLPSYTVVAPLEETDRLVSLACGLHQATPFDAVVSFSELGLLPAARVAQALGLPSNPLEAVEYTRDKYRMREVMAKAGLCPIRYRRCISLEDALAFGREAGYPFILKPVDGWASNAVTLVHTPDELSERYRTVTAEWPGAIFLAEEFVPGPEVSVEAFSIEGKHSFITITDKVTTGAPRFVETGHSMPSRLAREVQEQIIDVVSRFLTQIGHRTGPSHTEVRVGPNGPVIIESHTRPGGDFIAYMMELAFGVEMVGLTTRLLLGEQVDPSPRFNRAAAVRYLLLPPGRIESIQGLDEVRNTPGVAWVDFNLQPGQVVGEVKNSFTRHGCVVTVADHPGEAMDLAERMVKQIQVEVAPIP